MSFERYHFPSFDSDEPKGGGGDTDVEKAAKKFAQKETNDVLVGLESDATETEVIGAAVLKGVEGALEYNMNKEPSGEDSEKGK
jgi:hypothetical protein